jgi:hypothetical protein
MFKFVSVSMHIAELWAQEWKNLDLLPSLIYSVIFHVPKGGGNSEFYYNRLLSVTFI